MTRGEIEEKILSFGSAHLNTFGGSFQGGIEIQQFHDEIGGFIHALIGQPIKSYLEVGVAAGGTTFVVNHFLSPDTIVLVDDNKHHKSPLRSDILLNVDYKEIIGDCGDPAIIKQAELHGPYDLIFIDADHSYEAVCRDIRSYSPMLNPKGFVAFHDSVRTEYGVGQAMNKLLTDPEFTLLNEFTTRGDRDPCGIALFQRST